MSYAKLDPIHLDISDLGFFCVRITDAPGTDDWRSFYWSRDAVKQLISELQQLLLIDEEEKENN